MNRQNVAKWCREFEAGRSDVHDEHEWKAIRSH
jgi:hypothetical protein